MLSGLGQKDMSSLGDPVYSIFYMLALQDCEKKLLLCELAFISCKREYNKNGGEKKIQEQITERQGAFLF